jgi:AraC-like DNA-binding protein
MAYLTDWRMAVVQTMRRTGEPLKSIAPAAGYESSTALSRIFTLKSATFMEPMLKWK